MGWGGGGVGGTCGGGVLEPKFTYSFFLLIGMSPSPRRPLGRFQRGPPHPLIADKPVPLSSLDHLQPRERVLPLAAHDSEVQRFLEDGLSQCLVTRCRQVNIVFGDKWPQCRELFSDGAFGSERTQCVQNPHVADPIFEERALLYL